ncbi:MULTISPECIES: ThuA domain-containing protein [unclassified Novosphingobium]|uniref:ThuA domain-containing protein n=1 Tax=unclassified Novosphingobium TaxID=2644732 RepID=UPI0025D092A3|nr:MULTISPECIES: ThuA domain-containing protein [unclassified Novosphingobium]
MIVRARPGRWAMIMAAAVGLAVAAPVQARAPRLLDCPMRDAAFSLESPLIDVLLSDAAKAVIDQQAPGAIQQIPSFLSGTRAPTFSAILKLKNLKDMVPALKAADGAALDRALQALPVTRADQLARCARYDDERPKFKLGQSQTSGGKLRVLVFEKMTGFRDGPSVAAAHAAFETLAKRNGWAIAFTDKGGAMHRSVLRKFDVVIWNNVSGDVLTLSQRTAFRSFVENGGGYVGIHGSAGDPEYFWDWYPDTLIGARFIGHPNDPQFQDAQVVIEPSATGVGRDLGPGWTMNDEWYSFAKSPRLSGAHIIATLNEDTYKPGTALFVGTSLAMGADHPIAWARCVGKGRSFYSAIGHRPEVYADAHHLKLLEQGVAWSAQGGGSACSGVSAR